MKLNIPRELLVAADALAPCITMTLATLVMTMHYINEPLSVCDEKLPEVFMMKITVMSHYFIHIPVDKVLTDIMCMK